MTTPASPVDAAPCGTMTAVPSAAPELLEPAVEHPVLAPGPGWATDYRTLMKPRITLLVVLTTLAAMV